MGRHFVGFDNAIQYVTDANLLIDEALKNPLPIEPVPDWSFGREKKRAKHNEMFTAIHQSKTKKKNEKPAE